MDFIQNIKISSQKLKLSFIIGIVLSFLLIISILLLLASKGFKENNENKIIIYTSSQCEKCKQSLDLYKSISSQYKEESNVKVDLILVDKSGIGYEASIALMAAKDQGKYEQFLDSIFNNSNLSESDINDFAEILELDLNKFQNDRASSSISSELNKSINDFEKRGVSGSFPIVFVNNKRIEANGVEEYKNKISDLLNK